MNRYTEAEIRAYILSKLDANEWHLKLTEGTKNHEPVWYDGANTALREMLDDFGGEYD